MFNPELSKEILRKLPVNMVGDFVKYPARTDNDISDLESLSEYIYLKAKMYDKVGIIDLA